MTTTKKHFPPLPFEKPKALPAAAPVAAQAPPPPPPPKVVAAPPPPPPPPPAPATPAQGAYVARNPGFAHRAENDLFAALYPPSRVFHYMKSKTGGASPPPVNHDREQARATALALVQILDRGIVPEGFVLPEIRALESFIIEKEALEAAAQNRTLEYASGHAVPIPTNSTIVPIYPPSAVQNEQAKAKARERFDAIGPIPTRAEATERNARIVATLEDVSEPVRFAALSAACLRIAAQREVTGARLSEAAGIVVEAMLDAMESAPRYGIPVKSVDLYSEDERAMFGFAFIPAPGDTASEYAVAQAYTSDHALAERAGLLDRSSEEDSEVDRDSQTQDEPA